MNNTWPGWKSERLLGEGSFGKVYQISKEEFGIRYEAALKVISIPQTESDIEAAYAEGMDEASITEYFKSCMEDIVAEFALMSKLKGNSNIVSYEDHMVVQHEDGIGWDILIRMELLTPLVKYIAKNTLTEDEVIHLGIDLSRALKLCQKSGILHRDIKPENIFISKNGDFKLGDFGVARVAEKTISAMSRKGTYTYMAPEVYKGEEYGFSADLYSLGIVLYRFLNNNRTPFLPEYPKPIQFQDREMAFNERILGKEMARPVNGSEALKDIVMKACAFQPSDRFPNALELEKALTKLQREDAGRNVLDLKENKTESVEEDDERLDKTVGIDYAKKEDVPPQNTQKKKPKYLFVVIPVALVAVVAIVAAAVFVLPKGKAVSVGEGNKPSPKEDDVEWKDWNPDAGKNKESLGKTDGSDDLPEGSGETSEKKSHVIVADEEASISFEIDEGEKWELFKDVEIGEVVQFGEYVQWDEDWVEKEPIEWYVAGSSDEQLWLFAVRVIDASNWSGLDSCLDEIYDNAFNDFEKSMIGENGVFIVSEKEFDYFKTMSEHGYGAPTAYAMKKLGDGPLNQYWLRDYSIFAGSWLAESEIVPAAELVQDDYEYMAGVRPSIKVYKRLPEDR